MSLLTFQRHFTFLSLAQVEHQIERHFSMRRMKYVTKCNNERRVEIAPSSNFERSTWEVYPFLNPSSPHIPY